MQWCIIVIGHSAVEPRGLVVDAVVHRNTVIVLGGKGQAAAELAKFRIALGAT